jgi:hypothetical protein
MDRTFGTLSKFEIELGHPFAGLVGLQSVENDIVYCRWLSCGKVVDRPRAIKVLPLGVTVDGPGAHLPTLSQDNTWHCSRIASE